ncbi:MAG TPA: lytic transglycosylase domain-containing protein [Beijerinckiaceae bacterium]|jgi:soluble lytic murein transglycosylase-like protein
MILRKIASGALAAALLCGPAFAVEAQKPAGQEAVPAPALAPSAPAPASLAAGTEEATKEVRKTDARKKKSRKTEAREAGTGNALDGLIAQHAKANGIPEDLVHRVIRRESRYNPRAVGRGGTFGLMQIKHGTARALGYSGTPEGLLSADTNLTYGVRYLAGAYKVANGDPARAVAFFARGYYYDAKRKGMLASLPGKKVMPAEAEAPVVADVRETASISPTLFAPMPAPYFASDPK